MEEIGGCEKSKMANPNSTESKAKEIVKRYYAKQGIHLHPVSNTDGERGFDFRNDDSTLFVEVKGSTAREITSVLFRYFTNGEYEKAKQCIRQKKRYAIHLVIGIGSEKVQHFRIPAKDFVDRAKPEVAWALPIRKKDAQEWTVGL